MHRRDADETKLWEMNCAGGEEAAEARQGALTPEQNSDRIVVSRVCVQPNRDLSHLEERGELEYPCLPSRSRQVKINARKSCHVALLPPRVGREGATPPYAPTSPPLPALATHPQALPGCLRPAPPPRSVLHQPRPLATRKTLPTSSHPRQSERGEPSPSPMCPPTSSRGRRLECSATRVSSALTWQGRIAS